MFQLPLTRLMLHLSYLLHTREEIISIAIRKELGRIESPRYQQQIIENSQTIT